MPRRGTLAVIAILAAAQALALLGRESGSGAPARVATGLVAMRLGDWQGRDLGSLDHTSRQMLQPDAVISRLYRDSAGREVELLVIYGHRKATFHSPGQCLLGNGWNIVSKERASSALGGREVTMNRFRIQKDANRAVIFYGYVEGGRVTPSWVKHQFYLAGDRARGRLPMGALVRVTVPVAGDEAAADRVGLGFMQGVLPGVMRSFAPPTLPSPTRGGGA